MWFSPSCHSGKVNPNVDVNLLVSSWEFLGRRASVGYSSEAMGMTWPGPTFSRNERIHALPRQQTQASNLRIAPVGGKNAQRMNTEEKHEAEDQINRHGVLPE